MIVSPLHPDGRRICPARRAQADRRRPMASGGNRGQFPIPVRNQLVAVDASTGKVLKEIDLGPVWCGPTVSRGRIYVGTGNLLFAPGVPQEAYFPKSATGAVWSFGLPGEDEVSRMKAGEE
jgi:hypothetical protein